MTQLLHTLHTAIAAVRPPATHVQRRAATTTRELPAVLSIVEPTEIDAMAVRLVGESSTALLLPAGGLEARRPAASFTRAMIRAAASQAHVAVGTLSDAGWSQAALDLGAQHVLLGSAGWARMELAEPALLDAVFLPLEIEHTSSVLAVADADRGGALGFWDGSVHPHSALQARVGGVRARMDLLAAAAATYVFTLGARAAPLVAWTDDPVAAELVMLANRYLADERRGFEQRMPWEDARVQAAVERGLGVSGHQDLRICAWLLQTDTHAAAHVQALARVLGCAHAITNSEE
jgi:hypothetical protein